MKRVDDKPVQVGEHRSRYSFRLLDDESEQGSVESRMRLSKFFQALIDQPMLLRCGPTFAQEMAIVHNGTQWVLMAKAEADDA